MKALLILVTLFLLINSSRAGELEYSNRAESDTTTELKGSYFGQKPPGLVPEVFASGIISGAGYRLHSYPSFSPDGEEVCWAVIPPKVLYMNVKNGKWTKPGTAGFSESNIQAPFFSPDGKRIYFQVTRSGGFGSTDIWYVERRGENWGEPVNPGAPPNSELMEAQPSLTRSGTLYFTGTMQDVSWNRGIYFSNLNEDKFSRPEALGENINSEYIDSYPFISSDGNILLFSSSRPTKEEKDLKLFYCLKDNDGTWGNPVNLSERMGLKSPARFGSITPDGKYLLFLMEGNIYWVDSKILEE